MATDSIISLSLIIIVSVIIIVPSIKRVPGIGIILALIIIGLAVWFRQDGLVYLGLVPPNNWVQTIVISILLGVLISLASILIIEPLTDRLTRTVHDLTVVDNVRGNLKNLALWLVTVWILVAFIEEIIFRGFLMTELVQVLGNDNLGLLLSLLSSSVLFGLAHWYQGRSGTLSTAIIGLLLGSIFIWSKFNLWLPILTHGFIDTVGLALIYLNGDIYIKQWAANRSQE